MNDIALFILYTESTFQWDHWSLLHHHQCRKMIIYSLYLFYLHYTVVFHSVEDGTDLHKEIPSTAHTRGRSADAQRVEKVQYLKGLGFKPFPDSQTSAISHLRP